MVHNNESISFYENTEGDAKIEAFGTARPLLEFLEELYQ